MTENGRWIGGKLADYGVLGIVLIGLSWFAHDNIQPLISQQRETLSIYAKQAIIQTDVLEEISDTNKKLVEQSKHSLDVLQQNHVMLKTLTNGKSEGK